MHARTAAILTIAALALTACGSQKSASSKPTPTATTASATPSKSMVDQLIAWRDSGGGDTLDTLVSDLGAVDKASDPIDLPALLEACSTLTANLESAQQEDPVPDEDTNKRWALALEHLTNSATACTTGAVSENQDDFDLMASEMEIGIKHLDAVSENLNKFVQ
jgi:hypothetical protein